jgi:hypothetical protein
MSGGGVFAELGPSVPSAASVYARARKAREALQIACEVSARGPRQDVPRALKLIAEACDDLAPLYGRDRTS